LNKLRPFSIFHTLQILLISMQLGWENNAGYHGRVAPSGMAQAKGWLGLSEQELRVDKWNICLVQAAAICGSQLK
jgi:hypothetical protein